MREKLIEVRENYVRQIREYEKHLGNIDAAIKFFDEHPESEIVAGAMFSVMSAPASPFPVVPSLRF